MAFEQHIEADSPDDMGLLSSIIRAPVLGIIWMLGGGGENKSSVDEDADDEDLTLKNKRIDSELLDHKNGINGGDEGDGVGDIYRGTNTVTSDGCHGGESVSDIDDNNPHPAQIQGGSTYRATDGINNKENKENHSGSSNWSPTSVPDFADDTTSNSAKEKYEGRSSSPRGQSPDSNKDDQSTSSNTHPATETIMNDLVAVMDSNHITDKHQQQVSGPATRLLQTSQSKFTSSSTTSISASYSASTFPDSNTASNQSLPVHHPSQSSMNNDSNPRLRGKDKKMSWSDECGNRSLVEYFEEPPQCQKSKHWSSMRRSSWRTSRHSFDGSEGAGARRGETRVIKSALKRSGSYSPPGGPLYASNTASRGLHTSSNSTSSSESSFGVSSPGTMKSFRSISVIGSSDESDRSTSSSDHLPNKESAHSIATEDSMAAVTSTKLNACSDVKCVPSTLHSGCGQTSGGLIIPRGDRYFYPTRGGPGCDPRFQLNLGTGVPITSGQAQQLANSKEQQGEEQEDEKSGTPNAKAGGTPNNPLINGRSSPGHSHHFLPRPNGYISPQYGFYVNITPPTPEMYAKPAVLQQQLYQQFQSQNKYKAPSPIPEGSSFGENQIPYPQRFVGRSSVPRPSSKRATEERTSQLSSAATTSASSQQQQHSLTPTFTKNKKGISTLGENPHHGVWPSVPFG